MDSVNSCSVQSAGGGGDNEEHDSSPGGADPLSDYFIDFSPPHFESQIFSSHLSSATFPSNLSSSPYFNHSNLHQEHDLVAPSLAGLLLGGSEPGSGSCFPDLVPNTSLPSPTVEPPQQNGRSSEPAVIPGISSGSTPRKNPKKRTRASRRAPTTVLATDAANFRQMVQEFTGIPVAPFSRRLDPSSIATAYGSVHFESPPPLAAQSSRFLFSAGGLAGLGNGSDSNPSTGNNLGVIATNDEEPDLFREPILESRHTGERSS